MGKLGKYVKGVFSEGKKVRWPKKAEFWGNIAVVLTITVVVALFLAFDDFVAAKILGLLERAFKNFK